MTITTKLLHKAFHRVQDARLKETKGAQLGLSVLSYLGFYF